MSFSPELLAAYPELEELQKDCTTFKDAWSKGNFDGNTSIRNTINRFTLILCDILNKAKINQEDSQLSELIPIALEISIWHRCYSQPETNPYGVKGLKAILKELIPIIDKLDNLSINNHAELAFAYAYLDLLHLFQLIPPAKLIDDFQVKVGDWDLAERAKLAALKALPLKLSTELIISPLIENLTEKIKNYLSKPTVPKLSAQAPEVLAAIDISPVLIDSAATSFNDESFFTPTASTPTGARSEKNSHALNFSTPTAANPFGSPIQHNTSVQFFSPRAVWASSQLINRQAQEASTTEAEKQSLAELVQYRQKLILSHWYLVQQVQARRLRKAQAIEELSIAMQNWFASFKQTFPHLPAGTTVTSLVKQFLDQTDQRENYNIIAEHRSYSLIPNEQRSKTESEKLLLNCFTQAFNSLPKENRFNVRELESFKALQKYAHHLAKVPCFSFSRQARITKARATSELMEILPVWLDYVIENCKAPANVTAETLLEGFLVDTKQSSNYEIIKIHRHSSYFYTAPRGNTRSDDLLLACFRNIVATIPKEENSALSAPSPT